MLARLRRRIMAAYINLTPGDPAPWFRQRSISNPRFVFDSSAGRYIVLCFFGSGRDAHSQSAIKAARSYAKFFDDATASFYGVSHDAADEGAKRVSDHYPGYRYFWDFDGIDGRLYGSLPIESEELWPVRRMWVVLDPTLRVLKVVPFGKDQSDISEVLAYLDTLPPPSRHAGFELQAPILVLPNVFEPEFCRKLIALYEARGGEESGFMREANGKTVAVHDHSHKRRKDVIIHDQAIITEAQTRFRRRIVPMIKRAYQFDVTRMERYIVACYAAEDGATFVLIATTRLRGRRTAASRSRST
jgi:peroxiredoxin